METAVFTCFECKQEKGKARFSKFQWGLNADDQYCKLCEKKLRRQWLIADHYRVRGVAYEDFVGHLDFETEAASRDSLIGNYNLVLYAASHLNPCYQVHRTTKGTMNVSLKAWNDKPALYCDYCVSEDVSNCIEMNTSGSMIEHVMDWSAEKRLDIRGEFNPNAGSINCVAQRNHYSGGGDWWSQIGQEEDGARFGHFSCAGLQVVAERKALGLFPDSLCEEYRPENVTYIFISSHPDNLEIADGLMARYRDGRNSWMCRHLSVCPAVAFRIRQFVTPPPVIFAEKGDLVLEMDTHYYREKYTYMLFRKVREE